MWIVSVAFVYVSIYETIREIFQKLNPKNIETLYLLSEVKGPLQTDYKKACSVM